TFFPFAITSELAKGEALELKLESPCLQTTEYGEVPLVDAVATRDADTGQSAVFLVNRSMDDAVELTIDASGLGEFSVVSAITLADDDIHAANTLDDP